jgi:hypothetical protein
MQHGSRNCQSLLCWQLHPSFPSRVSPFFPPSAHTLLCPTQTILTMAVLVAMWMAKCTKICPQLQSSNNVNIKSTVNVVNTSSTLNVINTQLIVNAQAQNFINPESSMLLSVVKNQYCQLSTFNVINFTQVLDGVNAQLSTFNVAQCCFLVISCKEVDLSLDRIQLSFWYVSVIRSLPYMLFKRIV